MFVLFFARPAAGAVVPLRRFRARTTLGSTVAVRARTLGWQTQLLTSTVPLFSSSGSTFANLLDTTMASNSEDAFAKLVDEGPVQADKLLKEDEILSEEDKKKPETASCGPSEDGAEKKPKKACANCTCGLAEKEAEAQEPNPADAPKSSCGSCYLGDAFRCASCPYRGMPAFKPGEKVTIDTTSDDL